MKALAFVVAAVAAVAMVGCSGSDKNGSSSSGSSSSGSSGGTSSGTTGGTTGTSGKPYAGQVTFLPGSRANLISAAFGAAVTGTQCEVGSVQIGSCCYTAPNSAGSSGSTGGSGSTGTAPNAGTITITKSGSSVATLTPTLSGGRYTFQTATWNTGDTFSVSAAGGTIHAFSGNFTIPTPVTSVTPDITAGPTITRSSGVTFTFAAGHAGDKASVSIQAIDASSAAQDPGTLICFGDASTGSLNVPAQALAKFAADDSATVNFVLTHGVDVSPDNASVQLMSSDMIQGGAALQ